MGDGAAAADGAARAEGEVRELAATSGAVTADHPSARDADPATSLVGGGTGALGTAEIPSAGETEDRPEGAAGAATTEPA